MAQQTSPSPEQFSLETITTDILERLAAQFPICCASDEFHYFPHFKSRQFDWSRWDDFSCGAVSGLLTQIQSWDQALAGLTATVGLPERTIEVRLLRQVLTTLAEQLERVRFHERQPTFYLTVAAIGLLEALEHGKTATSQRVTTLPEFIAGVQSNLKRVPRLFAAMGSRMAAKLSDWIRSLQLPADKRGKAAAALSALKTFLDNSGDETDFRTGRDLYARIADRHMGCRLSIEGIDAILQSEIEECESILRRQAERISPGVTWQAVLASLPRPEMPPEGLKESLTSVVDELRVHCESIGLISSDFAAANPVQVMEIPDHLRAVRSNAAYSLPPGHPPRGGTFFIMPAEEGKGAPTDIRLLAAHETYPGHHLLDSCRWRLARPLRRALEFPIFYEGWASFVEELLFDTGFFEGPADRMLMAKRRFWRAVRGRTDVDIHTGRRNLGQAAASLAELGMPVDDAAAMTRRYALKPGYQLAYTVGRSRFCSLYDSFRTAENSPVEFARRVLAQGEISWSDLKKVLFADRRPPTKRKEANP